MSRLTRPNECLPTARPETDVSFWAEARVGGVGGNRWALRSGHNDDTAAEETEVRGGISEEDEEEGEGSTTAADPLDGGGVV